MSVRLGLALAVAVVLSLPSALAVSSPPAAAVAPGHTFSHDALEKVIRAWTSPLGGYAVTPYATAHVNGTRLSISSLGDINADQRADLLYVYDPKDAAGPSPSTGTSGRLEAHSGADPAKILWTAETGSSIARAIGDVDGDHILDATYVTSGDGVPHGTSQGAAVVYAEAGYGWTYPIVTHFVSGLDGRELAKVDGSTSYTTTGVDAFALLAFADAFATDSTWDLTESTAPKSIVRETLARHSRDAFTCAVVSCAFAFTGDSDLTIRFLDAKGAAVSTVDRTDPLVDVQSWGTWDLDGDAKPDALIVEVQGTGSAYVSSVGTVPIGKSIVTAFGNDGAKRWAVESSVGLLEDAFAIPVGDLDGDGTQDIGFIAVTASGVSSFHGSTKLLSGKDGSTIGAIELDNDVAFLLPFAKGAGGKAEALLIAGAFSATGATVGPVGLDLKPRWTHAIGDTFPINADLSDMGAIQFTDWTGDGRADIALLTVTGDTPELSATVELLSGADGKTQWTTTQAGMIAVAVLPDLTGVGSGDLAIGQQTGASKDDYTGATVSFTTFAGEDGGPLFRQVLRQPSGPAAAKGTFRVSIVGFDDIGGDGVPDVGARVDEGGESSGNVVISVGGPGVYGGSMAIGNVTWYIFSSGSKQVTTAATSDGSTGPGTGPGTVLSLPPAEDLSNGRAPPAAARPADDATAPHKSPGVEPVAALALVGLLAVLVRRRLK
ncbi:MAG: hypothetical protein V4510_11930 [bacterium]